VALQGAMGHPRGVEFYFTRVQQQGRVIDVPAAPVEPVPSVALPSSHFPEAELLDPGDPTVLLPDAVFTHHLNLWTEAVRRTDERG
jgi:hypothetical protein